MTKTTDALRAFYDRVHPGYTPEAAKHWAFVRSCYEGGREWFRTNIFRYMKEGDEEFADRVARAYRFNHTREAVDLVQKYLFKADISRKTEEAPEEVKTFWEHATLNGFDIDQLMRQSSTGSSIAGRVAIVVDNNIPAPEVTAKGAKKVSVADTKKLKGKIYAYVVNTEDILDYAFDEDGDGGLLWVKLREYARDDFDPINSDGLVRERIRLWTRNEWVLYEEVEQKSSRRAASNAVPQRKVMEIKRGEHGLGTVPVILHDHAISSDPYRVSGLIDDIAYLDRAVANYLSNLDAIIQDQTFSQLAIPAQSVQAGEDIYKKILELGTKRIFVFDGGAGSTARPEYLSPDPKQAGVILAVISKIINEIYHTIGLAGERTKEDNSQGIDNSSGVAKAYDFERVNSLLQSKAKSCERVENEIVRLVCLWSGKSAPESKLVTYPITFDVMRLADDLVTAEALAKLNAPEEVRREQMRILVDKLFPRLTADLKATIMADIKKWPESVEVALQPPSRFAGGKPAAAPSRQGQVTKNTPAK